ncbi:MAG: adenylate cyclase regulatory domain-containing protein [Actinomycetota bacterium]
MPTRDEYEAAGLLERLSAGEAERLALLDWLSEQGFSVAEMAEYHRRERLYALASDRAAQVGRPCSIEELAVAAGIDVEQAAAAIHALGLPDDEPILPIETAPLLREFATARMIFGEAATLHFARVLGSSLDRIAEAANSLFRLNVEAPMMGGEGGEIGIARIGAASVDSLNVVAEMLAPVLRAQFQVSIARMREAARSVRPDDERLAMAIGFVDLVGFTPTSSTLPARELLDLLLDFERHAHELVQAFGGRVVKLIGDEVMYAAVDAADACRIAHGLFTELRGRDDLTPRAGIAAGEVLAHGGDYYGAVVNLASRITDIAVPWEILLAPEVAATVPPGFRAVPAGRRLLKGFPEPVTLSSLELTPPA